MAEAVVAAVSAIGVETGSAFLIMNAQAVASAAILVGGLAYSAQRRRQMESDAKAAYNASQVDRLHTVDSTVAPRTLVMGRVRTAGSRFYRKSTGPESQWFYQTIALAAHEIDGVDAYYLNDQLVTLDGNGWVQEAPYSRAVRVSATAPAGGPYAGTPIDGTIQPVGAYLDEGTFVDTGTVTYQYWRTDSTCNIQLYTGAPGQAVDPLLARDLPADWTADDVATGVAYVRILCVYDEGAYPTGLPQFSAAVRGAKLYDPRTLATVYSTNPALMIRHVYTHANFGKAALSAAEEARIIAAANACDTSTNYVVNGVTEVNALYRASLVAEFGTPPASVLDDLAQAMGGSWAFAGGELFLKTGTYTAPVLHLTEADIAFQQASVGDGGSASGGDGISISPHQAQRSKFNTVTALVWDAAQGGKQVPHTLSVDALVTRDGATLTQQVSMPAVAYAPQALHIAGVMIRDARDPLAITIPFKLSAYALEVFDTFTLTVSRYGYGWVAKEFMVAARTWAPGGAVLITAKETAAAITTLDAAFSPRGLASNTTLHAPWDVADVANLALASGTAELQVLTDGTVRSRLRVSWSPVADAAVQQGGQVEVQYQLATADGIAGPWQQATVPGIETQVLIADVQDGQNYTVRARARTAVGVGVWSQQKSHRVIGKTEPPPVVTGVALAQDRVFWTAFAPSAVPDLAGFQVRAAAGAAGLWGSAAPLHDGLVVQTPWPLPRTLYGVQTVLVAAVDSSGNVGEAGSAVLDFGPPDLNNQVQDRAFALEAYPGTRTDCTVSGTQLLADADPASNIYALVDLYSSADVYATQYLPMQWVSEAFRPAYSGTVVLTSSMAGAGVLIEYRTDGSASTDIYALADVYAAADIYGTSPEWQAWPGAVEVARGVGLVFRVSVAAGSTRGAVSQFTPALVVPDVSQRFGNNLINSAGTRLDPATGAPPRDWIAVQSVQITAVVDGSGAITGRVLDFSPDLGPLVQLVDTTGAAVSGRATIDIGGFADL
jgi:hypothetical protein